MGTANVRHHHLTQSTCMGPDLFRPRSLRLSIPTWTPQAHRLGACTPCGRRRRHMYRHFSTTPIASSGHNRWSKIKHDKAKTDARTSKLRTQLSSDIIIASRLGGPNPSFNSRLSAAIAAAKKGQLSKSSIETPPDAVMDVAQRLQDKFGLRVEKAEVVYDLNEDSLVKLTAEQGEEVGKVLDALEEDPALQNLYVNATSQ